MTKAQILRQQIEDEKAEIRASRKTPETQSDLHPQTQMEPTPRPWLLNFSRYIQVVDGVDTIEVSADGRDNWIAQVINKSDAELIVRAVNSFDAFDDLLAALRMAEGGLSVAAVKDGTAAHIHATIAKVVELREVPSDRVP